MEEYKSIYSFDVIEKMKSGELVYCLDRMACKSFCMNEISAGELAGILRKSEVNATRYDFWVVKDSE